MYIKTNMDITALGDEEEVLLYEVERAVKAAVLAGISQDDIHNLITDMFYEEEWERDAGVQPLWPRVVQE